jgi:hypothetical protein
MSLRLTATPVVFVIRPVNTIVSPGLAVIEAGSTSRRSAARDTLGSTASSMAKALTLAVIRHFPGVMGGKYTVASPVSKDHFSRPALEKRLIVGKMKK